MSILSCFSWPCLCILHRHKALHKLCAQKAIFDIPNERTPRPAHPEGRRRCVHGPIPAVILRALLLPHGDAPLACPLRRGLPLPLSGGLTTPNPSPPGAARRPCCAVLWALWSLGDAVTNTGVCKLPLGTFGHVLAFIGGVDDKPYNFMDGIDGLAAGEALSYPWPALFLLGKPRLLRPSPLPPRIRIFGLELEPRKSIHGRRRKRLFRLCLLLLRPVHGEHKHSAPSGLGRVGLCLCH